MFVWDGCLWFVGIGTEFRGVKVNHRFIIPHRKGELILVRVGFDFHIYDFFIVIPIVKYNPNTLMDENGSDFSFSFSIPTFQT